MRTLSRGLSENTEEGKKQKQALQDLGMGAEAAFKPMNELLPELFQRLDRRKDTVLTVPEPLKEYKIVTRQSPSLLASTVTSDGHVKGDLHVSSPAFWDAGKFLILVRD